MERQRKIEPSDQPATTLGAPFRERSRRFLSAAAMTLGLSFCAMIVTLHASLADEVRLRNGDRLTGTIQGIEDGKLKFESASFGAVGIPSSDILAVSTDDVVTVELQLGGFATGRLSIQDDNTLLLSGPKETTSRFEYAALKAIHRGTEIPVPQFEWAVRVNLGASKSSGNTNNESLNIDAEAQGRGAKDRITLRAEFNIESTDGQETSDDQLLDGQYDRFISQKWFVYLQGSAERDRFQDLNLRTTIGPGAGRQIIDTEKTKLSVEAGPTLVNEDFKTAIDRDFITGRWAVKFDMFVFDKFAQIFHTQEALISLEDTEDLLVRTRQGARIPLRSDLNVTAQVNWDYDAEPAPGRDRTDTKYIVSLGYTF